MIGGGGANTFILSSPNVVEFARVLASLSDENECLLLVQVAPFISCVFSASKGTAVHTLLSFYANMLVYGRLLSYKPAAEVV